MSVDVEDYFQVSAFEGVIARQAWESLPCRVERNTERVLALFDAYAVKSTFFVLGWVAERYPRLINAIVAAGHELASHGYGHERVTQLTPEAFRHDVRRAKQVLEDIGGVAVAGYRAPSFTVVESTLWAHDILHEEGYRYSSSVYPIRHDLYGMPRSPRSPYAVAGGRLREIPISTVRLLGQNIPIGGGGYFRLLPYLYYSWGIRRVNEQEAQPCVFYFHPWEIDPNQPRQRNVSLKTRFRHYHNLDRNEAQLSRLLSDFRWDRLGEVYLNPSTEVLGQRAVPGREATVPVL